VLAVLALLAACGEQPTGPGAPTVDRPGALSARYEWALDGWVRERPVGQPTVQLSWQVPTRWSGQPFRVYGRRSTDRDYRLVATVTSCAEGSCRYTDADVVPGQRYDFYVAVVDERSGTEQTTPSAVQVDVPSAARPVRPAAPVPVALDGMLFLRLPGASTGGAFWKFLVFQERRNADSVFFEIGSTDGNGFLDGLAQNGVAYRYSVAALDTLGHVSDRSPISEAGIPRPDAAGELVYASSDSLQLSGFRFDPTDGGRGERVAGNSAQAHWRLEADQTGWRIRPLNGAAVVDAGFSTALTCGPGADTGCQDVRSAPESGYSTEAIPLQMQHTYVVRTGSGASVRYAKLRVQILGFGAQERRLMVFDWAFQPTPGVRNLNISR